MNTVTESYLCSSNGNVTWSWRELFSDTDFNRRSDDIYFVIVIINSYMYDIGDIYIYDIIVSICGFFKYMKKMYVSYINDIGHRIWLFYMQVLQGRCIGNKELYQTVKTS